MLTTCISWPFSDEIQSFFAPYGPSNEQGRRMQNSTLFLPCSVKCKRNGSSCTAGNTDILNCLDSKRVEEQRLRSVLCLHHQPTSGIAVKIHNFIFIECLKGTFRYFRMNSFPLKLILKIQWGFVLESLLRFPVSSMARPVAKVNT